MLMERVWLRNWRGTRAGSGGLMESEQAPVLCDLLLMSQKRLSLLTLRSPTKAGVSKGEAELRPLQGDATASPERVAGATFLTMQVQMMRKSA
ncbi:hypothetical protein SSBR45G_51790 [Bradyrhizobium sp. SSBR45G]|nr:hypothetical protein SSBR45G_51790 [Bradyrhizobium sp. SSBR45G]GLH87764.1 hypothetical protein SSBR45R_52240 [Bradyrhizobium sp. SSBR45R]